MTVEMKYTFSLDDIEAFEITCTECGTLVAIPVSQCVKTTDHCPRCGQRWYSGGAADSEAILSLARAIADIKSELKIKPKFGFRVRFSGCEEAASRASGA